MNKLSVLGIALLFFLNGCKMKEDNFLVIGHRGAMGYETENTLASIEKALDLGVDMIEIDVFKIQSGEIVVFHDERLERLSNAAGNIEEYTIFELRKVILDGNHKIPMLQDVLKLVDNKVALNIELKGANTADRVNFIIDYYVEKKGWALDDFVISSFNWDELREMRSTNPDIAIAVLTEENPLEAIPIAKELNAIAVNPWYKTLTAENTKQIQDAGFKVFTYTVNEAEDIFQMRNFGVDGIFTNYPDRAN
ncbi:glycerophosphodiester phosphodiesterase [Croceitalea sp. MTPC9]|uniref:glycerophosphodiester phosphodiesterase n=1 Tax=unclassified Croceitalea TaxID=2632280 RepID=UPI002B3D9626|nr:glycerophosphodiester phosphodiesterase [Croceitalea sp. MTPC6]GMN17002.1 glycerophosphodiester phosphodiesterase [Croceitalea sp. MTPC9]